MLLLTSVWAMHINLHVCPRVEGGCSCCSVDGQPPLDWQAAQRLNEVPVVERWQGSTPVLARQPNMD